MNPQIDLYLEEGCGRCSLHRTPECKVRKWPNELRKLRKIVLEAGLEEELKWSNPCYTFKGKNVLMVSALNDHAVLAFFKGSLLQDEENLLVTPGVNSQASRQFRFTSTTDILKLESTIKAYIYEAIEIEKAGLKVEFKKELEPIPSELEEQFSKSPELKVAFESLTPGRQRGYILHFSQPKQSKTRTSRIEKFIPKILNGKGFHDR